FSLQFCDYKICKIWEFLKEMVDGVVLRRRGWSCGGDWCRADGANGVDRPELSLEARALDAGKRQRLGPSSGRCKMKKMERGKLWKLLGAVKWKGLNVDFMYSIYLFNPIIVKGEKN
ncbi:hypothetical protein U1Q18_041159, partial [Sarracenia purpurea var. burkii]